MMNLLFACPFAPFWKNSGDGEHAALFWRICRTAFLGRAVFLILPVFLFTACSIGPGRLVKSSPPQTTPKTTQGGGYYKNDGPAETSIDLDAIPDAQPKEEPLHRWANRPYEVLGKKYVPQTQIKAFRQEGIASWYGKQFHGQKTSIGETYDMFAMTAAHPTLPLPSYARVTNPANGRSVVLRVNDRGPFHAGRIMDLSYAAAYRLGYVNEGSVRVIVETLVPGDENFVAAATTPRTVAAVPATRTAAAAPPLDAEGLDILFRQLTEDSVSAIAGAVIEAPSQGIFLQLGAFANIENAENLKNRLISELEWLSGAIHLEQSGQLHRLQLGPYPSRAAAEFVAQRIREGLGYTPTIISR